MDSKSEHINTILDERKHPSFGLPDADSSLMGVSPQVTDRSIILKNSAEKRETSQIDSVGAGDGIDLLSRTVPALSLLGQNLGRLAARELGIRRDVTGSKSIPREGTMAPCGKRDRLSASKCWMDAIREWEVPFRERRAWLPR